MAYLRPVGRITGPTAEAAIAAEIALRSGRPSEAFGFVEILERGGATRLVTAASLRHDPCLAGFAARRKPWAGLPLDRPLIMGVVNVTPDSFSDGGEFVDPASAIAHGRRLLTEGADLLDIGGESTRPGALPIAPEIEAKRALPVIRALAAEGAIVSVDTRHVPVMAAALDAGARIVNDVTALAAPGALDLVAARGACVLLMHMQGDPETMQRAPHYDDAALDVFDFLAARIAACRTAGMPLDAVMIDPGIGFGKTLDHNLDILRALALYRTLGCGVALGVSRKGFIGRLTGVTQPKDRRAGSLAAGLFGIAAGADLLRVHDVRETVEALRVVRALEGGMAE